MSSLGSSQKNSPLRVFNPEVIQAGIGNIRTSFWSQWQYWSYFWGWFLGLWEPTQEIYAGRDNTLVALMVVSTLVASVIFTSCASPPALLSLKGAGTTISHAYFISSYVAFTTAIIGLLHCIASINTSHKMGQLQYGWAVIFTVVSLLTCMCCFLCIMVVLLNPDQLSNRMAALCIVVGFFVVVGLGLFFKDFFYIVLCPPMCILNDLCSRAHQPPPFDHGMLLAAEHHAKIAYNALQAAKLADKSAKKLLQWADEQASEDGGVGTSSAAAVQLAAESVSIYLKLAVKAYKSAESSSRDTEVAANYDAARTAAENAEMYAAITLAASEHAQNAFQLAATSIVTTSK